MILLEIVGDWKGKYHRIQSLSFYAQSQQY